ncbi:MAG: tape measure protein, partial [Candidatus Nanopelagicales bacterium]
APMQLASAYGRVDKAAAGAARSISSVKQQGDAITGQIKNVLGMAFGYQAIHAVASQLQQVFGHLQGGVVQFNSMLEQATVGFTTLFKNQAQQAQATNELLGENAVGIDYIAMGYQDAQDAAEGVIETIRQFANVTPFRFAELQESTLRMRAFGFDMSEILREDTDAMDKFSGGIVAVGNAVAALGGGADAFRRITYALGQMKQAGRVYQNDMMQLANAGIGGYKYIAEALMKEITTDGSGNREKIVAGQEVLYKQLESNAIETVRRLTTSGKVSGEAASRAILAGLERDFGGGMIAQSKTFAGAFSTIADMSQSLVADSFRPLYNAIRDIAYEFSLFLQESKVRDAALAFGEVVEKILKQLRPMGALMMSIGQKIGRDFSNAMSAIGSRVGGIGGTFGAFAIGIREIIKLLENDFARTVIATAALIGIAFKFASANPF